MSDATLKDTIVVGTGISGLAAAKKLQSTGRSVLCLEKARGVGGRTSVRRVDENHWADLGAPFFTVRDSDFGEAVESLKQDGTATEWQGKMAYVTPEKTEFANAENRFVVKGGMNKVAKHLGQDCDIRTQTKVNRLDFKKKIWTLETETGEKFQSESVVLAVPIDQAVNLISTPNLPVHFKVPPVSMLPCWASVFIFKEKLDLPYTGYFIKDHEIAFIADNYGKVGDIHKTGMSLTVQANHDWSRMYLEKDPEWVLSSMQKALSKFVGKELPEMTYAKTHRWRFANCTATHEPSKFFFPEEKIILCGDWVMGGRVEGAFMSGQKAASMMITQEK